MTRNEDKQRVGVNLRLQQDRYQKLKQLAEAEERTLAKMADILVREALDQREAKENG